MELHLQETDIMIKQIFLFVVMEQWEYFLIILLLMVLLVLDIWKRFMMMLFNNLSLMKLYVHFPLPLLRPSPQAPCTWLLAYSRTLRPFSPFPCSSSPRVFPPSSAICHSTWRNPSPLCTSSPDYHPRSLLPHPVPPSPFILLGLFSKFCFFSF